jgi:ribonuclease BN (tRNA processing enzyme)
VLDAGTGIRKLDELLGGSAFTGRLVLGHLHWDHVQGLPFSESLLDPETKIRVFLPTQTRSARDTLAAMMSPPLFPITPDDLKGEWNFDDVPGLAGDTADGLTVRTCDVEHGGGRTVAVRVDDEAGASFAYVSDHAIHRGVSDELVDLLNGVTVLAHDAQYFAGEEQRAWNYGHSTVDEAMALADRCAVGRLVLTHHLPGRTDDALDALHENLAGSGNVIVATEGLSLDG